MVNAAHKIWGKINYNSINLCDWHIIVAICCIMKLFTTPQIREIDRYTIDVEGVGEIDLIERVAEGVTYEIESRWRPGRPTVIFAGPGNNGADALAVARILAEHGYNPSVYLFNIGGNALSAACRAYRDALRQLDSDLYFQEITSVFSFPKLTPEHLVIDGIFGTGLRENLKGGYISLVRNVNESGATVVSIDLPTGMMGDSNPCAINYNILHAHLTLAIQFPRISFFNPDNTDIIGEWKVIDIGLSDKAINDTVATSYLIEADDIQAMLRQRHPNSSKADYGSCLLVAGSYGMMGAAVLAARGALRSGVGKVTVEAPQCGYDIIQSSVPEALYQYNKGEYYVTGIKPEHNYDAIGLGPGLGTNDATLQALENFLLSHSAPVVLDADALGCMARKPTMLNSIPAHSILTPHTGEFDRLFGTHTSCEARLAKAVDMSKFYNIIIVLKGHNTAVVRPDGVVCYNSSGTPAMATAGSGDVLTGIMTSLLAQGYKPDQAAVAAVYIHGIAGELAAKEQGDYGVTAGDIARHTGRAIMSILNKQQ